MAKVYSTSSGSTSKVLQAIQSLVASVRHYANCIHSCAPTVRVVTQYTDAMHELLRGCYTAYVTVVMKCLVQSAGKAVVNSPLFKCAVAGNDPNVGRLVCAIGNYLGPALKREGFAGSAAVGSATELPSFDDCTISIGGMRIFEKGAFQLQNKEAALVDYFKGAQMWGTSEMAVR